MKLLGILFLFLLLSCKKDKADPVVNYLKLNSSIDTLVINLDNTSKYLLESSIDDDKEISQVRIFTKGIKYFIPSDSSLFSNYLISYFENVNSNSFHYSDSIEIPFNTTAGLYSLNISGADKSGNEGLGTAVFLLLTSSSAPSQSIIFPDFSGNMPTFSAGDTLKINGTVNDNIAVQKVNTGLFFSDYTVLTEQNFTVSGAAITSWDFQTNNSKLIIPNTVLGGVYIFKVEMGDNDGNMTIFVDSIAIN